MGLITCPHGVHVGTCRCPKDMPGAGKCPPECRKPKEELKETAMPVDYDRVKMTRDQWITYAMGLLGTLADYVPRHLEEGDRLLRKISALQNARFTDEE